MHASMHLVRNLIATAVTLVALVVAAAAVDGALATVVVLLELGLIVMVLPLVVIHYDEHEERLKRHHPGQP